MPCDVFFRKSENNLYLCISKQEKINTDETYNITVIHGVVWTRTVGTTRYRPLRA